MNQLCYHKRHYSFTAKRLTYKGMGNYDYSYFTVYSHHKKWKYARQDVLCNREYGLFVVMGRAEELDLTVIRPIGDKA